MNDKNFNEPRIALNRIYTRAGEGGDTRLVGGQRVPRLARSESVPAKALAYLNRLGDAFFV